MSGARIKAADRLLRSDTKDSPVRSKAYLSFVRGLPCAWCRAVPPSEPSHHPRQGHGSMGAKCCDLRTIPLCHRCHHNFHQHGRLGLMGGDLTRWWAEEQITQTLSAYLREKGCV